MASSQRELEKELTDAGNKLLMFPSHAHELLTILDEVEGLLSRVEQAPLRSMQHALYPSMKALISNQLLRHSDVDVKVSVASCMSELTRITAPNAPYNDEQMKEIFELIIMALGKLSCEPGCCYSKAIKILDNVAKVRSCLLMLDLEYDPLIVDIFQQFLSSIRSDHPPIVFNQMEYIMTLTIAESEEISHELLSILLSSVKKVNQNVSRKLGEKVLNNCAVELQPLLSEAVKCMNLDLDNYSDVVTTICHDSPKEHEVAEEAGPSSGGSSMLVMENGITQLRNDGTLTNKNSLKTQVSCHQGKQQEKTVVRRSNSQTEYSDAIRTLQAEAETVIIPKKRGRKPSSSQHVSHTDGSQPRKGRPKKNATSLALDEIVVKKEPCDSKEYIDKDSRMPHGLKVYGYELIGRRIKVWWPLDEQFYEGAIYSFDPSEKKHKVLYADGEEETLDLSNERWELVDKIEQHADLPSPATLSRKPRKKKAKTKPGSSAKQKGILSSSKRHRSFADESKIIDDSTPDAVCVADTTTDDITEIDPKLKNDAQKSSVYFTTPDDVAKDNNTTQVLVPKLGDDEHKSDAKEETETRRSITKPNPDTSEVILVESASQNTGTEKRESANEGEGEGKLSDSLKAQ